MRRPEPGHSLLRFTGRSKRKIIQKAESICQQETGLVLHLLNRLFTRKLEM